MGEEAARLLSLVRRLSKKLAILDIHHLRYLAMAPLPNLSAYQGVCLTPGCSAMSNLSLIIKTQSQVLGGKT